MRNRIVQIECQTYTSTLPAQNRHGACGVRHQKPRNKNDLRTMGSLFDSYDKEVGTLLQAATKAIADGDGMEAAERHLVEATEMIESMNLEAATAPAALRTQLRVRITARQAEAARMQRELRDAERTALFGDTSERARMVDDTRALERGGRHIAESRRTISSTEAVGAAILDDLQKQRGTIMRARDTVVEIDGGIDASRNIIAGMNRRAAVNRLAIYGVFGAIAFSVALVLFYRIK